MLYKKAAATESFFNASEDNPKGRGGSAYGQWQSTTDWQTLKSCYPKRLSRVVGTGGQLWLSAIAFGLGIWLWPLAVQNRGYVSPRRGMEEV